MRLRLNLLLFISVLLVVAMGFAGEGESGLSDIDGAGDFLRFNDTGGVGSRIETAIADYTRVNDGTKVSLIGAIHVGDASYYETLSKDFERYEALLYELVLEDPSDLSANDSDSAVSFFQRGMKDMLGLEFQLDAIDYTKENFVHADMDADTFRREQRKKGESLLSFMLSSMMAGMKQQAEGKGAQLSPLHLLAAFASEDRSLTLKYLLAREFDSMDYMMDELDGEQGGGTVLLSGRNKVAIRVLREQIGLGNKHLGIFYGAAHLPDLERRLLKMGFRHDKTNWLVAWDIKGKKQQKPVMKIQSED